MNDKGDSNGGPAQRYKRVLLKISGESLMGGQSYGIDPEMVATVASQVRVVVNSGVEACLVIGGGNIFRGVSGAAAGWTRHRRLHGHACHRDERAGDAERAGKSRCADPRHVRTSHQRRLEPYIRRRAMRHLEKGRVVIFAAGTGNPFFTTDTAAALRASEMACEALLKGTRVDGVYSSDPEKDPEAVRYETLSYLQVLSEDLRVMDASAVSLARENAIPIIVFSIEGDGGFARVLQHKGKFTIVS